MKPYLINSRGIARSPKVMLSSQMVVLAVSQT